MIVSPRDGEIVSGDVTVAAFAFDDKDVTGVDFVVDDSPLGPDEDGSDGWSVVWDTSQVGDGGHTLTATATDTIGQKATDRVSVVVDNELGLVSPDGRPTRRPAHRATRSICPTS